MPLQVIRPQEKGLSDLYAARYTLIRPDQHVAWRGDNVPGDAENLLLQVTGRAARQQQEERWAAPAQSAR